MSTTNLLAGEAKALSATHAARLYVLTRDAYLSPPAVTRAKLTALDDLRRVVTDSGIPDGDLPGIAEVTAVSGVRLMERLRLALRTFHVELDARTRHLVLVDVLTSTWPPTGAGPASDLTLLVADAGTYLAPEVTIPQIHRMVRQHRATARLLSASARRGRINRHLGPDDDGPVGAVRDMVAEVLGLCPPAATCASIVLLGGGSLEGGRHGLAGGAILETMHAGPGDAGGRACMVGTALARIDPDALVHELAVLDTVTTLHRDLRAPVRELLAGLLDDIDAATATGAPGTAAAAEESARLQMSRRAVALEIRRLGATPRPRWVPHPRARGARLDTGPGILGT